MKHPYYAVVYAYDKDGSEKASMPCFTAEQMMQRAARYEKVRVVMDGQPPFWLRLTRTERDKYPLPKMDDIALELMRDYGKDFDSAPAEEPTARSGPPSDRFYDIWKGVKKDRRW